MPTVPKETIASVIAPVLLHVGRGGRGYSEYWTDIGTAGGSIMWKKLRLGMAVKANTLRAVFYGFCGTATNLPVTGDVSGNPTRVTYGYQLEVLLRRTDGSSPVNFLLTDPKGGPYIQIGDWTKFWTNISTGVSTDGHKPAVTPKITITAPLAHEALPATATFLCKTWAPADATLSTKIPVYQHWAITTDGEGNYTGGAASQNKWFGGGGAAEVDPIDTTSYTTGPNLLLGEPVLANQRSFLVMADSIGEGYSGVPTTTLDNKNYNWQYAPNQATGYAAKALERLGQCYAGFNQGGQKLSQLFPGFTTGTYFLRHNTDFDPVRFGVMQELLPFFTDVILVVGTNDFAANWMTTTNGDLAYLELLTSSVKHLRMNGIKRVYVCTIPPQSNSSGSYTSLNNAYLNNPSGANKTALETTLSIQLNSAVEAHRKSVNTAIISSIPTHTDGSPLWIGLPTAAALTTTNGGAEVFLAGAGCPDGVHVQFDNESGASPTYPTGGGTVTVCGQTTASLVIAPTSSMSASLLKI